MKYYILLCLFMFGCTESKISEKLAELKKEAEIELPSGGPATSAGYLSEGLSVEDSIKLLNDYIAKNKAKLAYYEQELKTRKEQLAQERRDRIAVISYTIAGICLVGLLACVFLYCVVPVLKKTVATIGLACLATMLAALIVPEFLNINFAILAACIIVLIVLCIGGYILFKYKNAIFHMGRYYDSAKTFVDDKLVKEFDEARNNLRMQQDPVTKTIITSDKGK